MVQNLWDDIPSVIAFILGLYPSGQGSWMVLGIMSFPTKNNGKLIHKIQTLKKKNKTFFFN